MRRCSLRARRSAGYSTEGGCGLREASAGRPSPRRRPGLRARPEDLEDAAPAGDPDLAEVDEAVDEGDAGAGPHHVRSAPRSSRPAGHWRQSRPTRVRRHEAPRRIGGVAGGVTQREVDQRADHPPVHDAAAVLVLRLDHHADRERPAFALDVERTHQFGERARRADGGEAGRNRAHMRSSRMRTARPGVLPAAATAISVMSGSSISTESSGRRRVLAPDTVGGRAGPPRRR